MTTYLSMNGTSDYLRTPQLTVTRIVLDFLFVNDPTSTLAQYLFDPRGGTTGNFMVYLSTANVMSKGNNVSTLLYNGSSTIPNPFPQNTRGIVDATFSTTVTEDSNGIEFFINFAAQPTSMTKGNIYDIKLYNGATLVAHYDMSTGTVNDQSGNANNATLTGGTWLDDGTGGTGTTYTGAGTSQGVSSLTTTEKQILTALGTAQGQTILTVQDILKFAENGTTQGISLVSGNAFLLLKENGSSVGQTSLFASEIFISGRGTIYSEGGITQGYSLLITNERMIHAPIPIPMIHLNGHIVSIIQLKGYAPSVIQLKGNTSSIIQLKGGKP